MQSKILTTNLLVCFMILLIFLPDSTTTFTFAQSSSSSSSSCAQYNFISNKVFSSCNDLPYLNSFLHWTYNSSSKTVKIAYRHTAISSSSSKWVAWAINPTAQNMIGAQALVAYQKSDGTITAYTSPVSVYRTQLEKGSLSFPVSDLSATHINNEIIIFATLEIQNLNSTIVNQVWQDGPVSNDIPTIHSTTGPNMQSMATINLLSGESTPTTGGSRIKKKNIHGVVNAVSWGILMPLGAVIARYLRVFPCADPAWFYLHATCQLSGYIVGVAGWATGIHLGKQSKGIQYTTHRIIGILLFCLATIQVVALLLRPKKEHKYRFYWNIYHHSFGYTIIILSIVNIFKGFDILNPEEKWKRAYIGTIAALGALAIILEVYTWFIVGKKSAARVDHNNHRHSNGANGSINGTHRSEETI